MVDVVPWTMVEGRVVEYRIDDQIFMLKPKSVSSKTRLMTTRKPGETSKLISWLNGKKLGDVFTLDDFYLETGTSRKSNHRYEPLMFEFVRDNYVQQIGGKRLRLLRKVDKK